MFTNLCLQPYEHVGNTHLNRSKYLKVKNMSFTYRRTALGAPRRSFKPYRKISENDRALALTAVVASWHHGIMASSSYSFAWVLQPSTLNSRGSRSWLLPLQRSWLPRRSRLLPMVPHRSWLVPLQRSWLPHDPCPCLRSWLPILLLDPVNYLILLPDPVTRSCYLILLLDHAT